MLRRSRFSVALALLMVIGTAPIAAADASGDCDGEESGRYSHCDFSSRQPGDPPTVEITPIVDGESSSGGSSEPRKCYSRSARTVTEIPCEVDGLVWVSASNCYVDPVPISLDEDGSGGTFRCYIGGPDQGASGVAITIWLPVAPPASAAPPSPAVLAQRAVDSMQLRAIEIGMAPEPNNADPNILIRMPNQVFAADSGPETTGPNSAEASAGGSRSPRQPNSPR